MTTKRGRVKPADMMAFGLTDADHRVGGKRHRGGGGMSAGFGMGKRGRRSRRSKRA